MWRLFNMTTTIFFHLFTAKIKKNTTEKMFGIFMEKTLVVASLFKRSFPGKRFKKWKFSRQQFGRFVGNWTRNNLFNLPLSMASFLNWKNCKCRKKIWLCCSSRKPNVLKRVTFFWMGSCKMIQERLPMDLRPLGNTTFHRGGQHIEGRSNWPCCERGVTKIGQIIYRNLHKLRP